MIVGMQHADERRVAERAFAIASDRRCVGIRRAIDDDDRLGCGVVGGCRNAYADADAYGYKC
jgi:hypothetical protein